MEATGIQGGGLCTTESHSEHHLEAAYTSRSSRLQKGPLIHFEGCLPNLPTALYAPDSRKFLFFANTIDVLAKLCQA